MKDYTNSKYSSSIDRCDTITNDALIITTIENIQIGNNQS